MERLNKALSDALTNEINKMFVYTNYRKDKEDYLEIDETSDKYILASDENRYNILMQIKMLIDISKNEKQDIYVFKLLEITKDNNLTITDNLYLKKNTIKEFTNYVIENEKYLNTKDFIVSFPTELYKYQKEYDKYNLTIPGKNFQFPLPQNINQSSEEYELYLEDYYKKHDTIKKIDQTGKFRLPYPHEQINFKKNYKINTSYKNEHYLKLYDLFTKTKGNTNKIKSNKKYKVINKIDKSKINKTYNKGFLSSIINIKKIANNTKILKYNNLLQEETNKEKLYLALEYAVNVFSSTKYNKKNKKNLDNKEKENIIKIKNINFKKEEANELYNEKLDNINKKIAKIKENKKRINKIKEDITDKTKDKDQKRINILNKQNKDLLKEISNLFIDIFK